MKQMIWSSILMGIYLLYSTRLVDTPNRWEQSQMDKKNNRLVYSRDADYYKASDFMSDYNCPIHNKKTDWNSKN